MNGDGFPWRAPSSALPTLPAVASRILEIILDEDYDAAELAEAIHGDPTMAARLLEVVNAASMGLRYPVKSVQHAITVLGDKSVRMIVFGMTVRQALETQDRVGGLDRHMFWKHATATAAAARTIASLTGLANPEEAYLCGLMHDLGRLALSIAEPEGFATALDAIRDRDHDDARDCELRHAGAAHDEVGAHLADCWKLPTTFAEALALHHDEEAIRRCSEASQSLLKILGAADYLSSVSGYPALETRRPPRRRAWFAEILDRIELDFVIAAMQEELARMEPLFEYGPEDDDRWRALFLRTNAELSRVVMELEERHRLQRALNQTLVRSRASQGAKGPVEGLLTECVANFGFDRAWIVQVTPGEERLELYAQAIDATRIQRKVTLQSFAIGPDETLDLDGGARVLDVSSDGFAARFLRSAGATSGIVVPVQQKLRLGYLWIVDMVDGHPLPAVDPSLVQFLAEEAGLMVQNHELYRQVHQLAITDPLTQVANRRNVMDTLQREVQRAQRTGTPMAIALFDLDHFKTINDTLGHQAGDEVLETTAAILRENVRRGDVVGRYGGEEFLIVLPGADVHQAREVAERICVAVRAYGKEHNERFAGQRISTSGGVAVLSEKDRTFDSLIARGDEALYAAKKAGRDRVVCAGLDPIR